MDVTDITKVVKMENILQTTENNESKAKIKSKDIKKDNINTVIKGKPKSGRIWKNERKRFSSIIKTRGIRSSVEKKQKLREELARVKEASRAVKAAKEEEKRLHKERRRENLKRQEENRKKSEVVQIITNTSKIKKMKKKHLRNIEKRDTNPVNVM